MSNILEALYFNLLNEEELNKKIILVNKELIDSNISNKKGVIAVLGHFGNWELLTFLPKITGWEVVAIGKKIKPDFLGKLIFNFRSKNGMKILTNKNSLIPLYKALKRNKIVAFLIDQRTRKPGSVKINFAGKEIFASAAPAHLHAKLKTPVIFVYSDREKIGSHKVSFFELELTGDIIKDTQIIQNKILEFIKKNPLNWFWLHSKFKSKKRVLKETI